MSRSGISTKRTIQADPVYGNRLVTKLINRIMIDGKKSIAENQVYNAFKLVTEKIKNEEPLQVFRQAIENIKPQMEVRSRRVGGAAYQVPMPVRGARKEALAIRWLVSFSRKRSSKTHRRFADKLAAEIVDAYNNEGEAVKKKDTTHKMAEANKAFAHFRW